MSRILLDQDRQLTWGPASVLCRVGELPNPPKLGDLNSPNGAKSTRALVVFVWGCLDRPNPFEAPDDLASWFDKHPDQLGPAVMALAEAVKEATGPKAGAVPPTGSPVSNSEYPPPSGNG